MIRQKVDRHGIIAPLEPESELPGCSLPPSEVGVIKEGPVRKWMAAKKQWDTKFASSKRKVQKQRAKEMAKGYYQFGDEEVPSPSALAGRRTTGEDLKEKKRGKSYGMSMWALWGSKHDEKTTIREAKADKEPETSIVSPLDGANARGLHDTKTKQGKKMDVQGTAYNRSRSRRRTVTDQNQTGMGDVDENTPAAVLYQQATQRGTNDSRELRDGNLTPDFITGSQVPSILVRSPTIERDESELKRPKAGGIAYPFSLKQEAASASMTTLTSAIGVSPVEDLGLEGTKNSGLERNSAEKDNSAATETRTGQEAPIAKAIHLPFQLKREATTASMTTLTSSVGVPPTTDLKIEGANDSGVRENSTDRNAAAALKGGKEMEAEQPVVVERPPLDTFVTAVEDLPKASQ